MSRLVLPLALASCLALPAPLPAAEAPAPLPPGATMSEGAIVVSLADTLALALKQNLDLLGYEIDTKIAAAAADAPLGAFDPLISAFYRQARVRTHCAVPTGRTKASRYRRRPPSPR